MFPFEILSFEVRFVFSIHMLPLSSLVHEEKENFNQEGLINSEKRDRMFVIDTSCECVHKIAGGNTFRNSCHFVFRSER